MKKHHGDESEILAEALSGIMHKVETPKRSYRLRRSLRITLWALLSLVVAGLLVGVTVLVSKRSPATGSQIPVAITDIKKSIDFTLYYPDYIPDNYKFDPSTDTSTSSGIVFMLFHSSTGDPTKDITVSQQIKPPIDYNQLLGPEEKASPEASTYGQLYLARNEEGTNGALITDTSWVLIRTPIATDPETIRGIAKNLRVVN